MKNIKNPLVFVVEPNQVFRDLITGYLTERKILNVKSFENSGECLKNMELKPDVVVLDYSMTGIDSLGFMHKIKKLLPRTDFIFLSGQNNVETAVHCIKQGAYDYLIKTDHVPEKLVKSIISDISETKKLNMKIAFRKGLIGFFTLLVLFILFVVGIRYILDL
jgi:DNA-binding NtrC family response regulator